MENASGNAKDTSTQIPNNMINLCEEMVRNNIVFAANNSAGFSIRVDETAVISGEKQLLIEVRFFDEQYLVIREEFLDFTPLNEMEAEAIAG